MEQETIFSQNKAPGLEKQIVHGWIRLSINNQETINHIGTYNSPWRSSTPKSTSFKKFPKLSHESRAKFFHFELRGRSNEKKKKKEYTQQQTRPIDSGIRLR